MQYIISFTTMDSDKETWIECGSLKGLWQPMESHFRQIEFEGVKVLHGIYFAVRDANWGTIKAKIISSDRQSTGSGWFVSMDLNWQEGEVDFIGSLRLQYQQPDVLSFHFDGKAQSTFQTNRIGFLILHGHDCSNKRVRIEKTDGTIEAGTFPEAISPHQPFTGIRSITHEPVPGLEVQVRMEGETFEMEDQRNWTDASYKTYSTPLSLPFPRTIEKGSTVSQSVVLNISKLPDYQPMEHSEAIAIKAVSGAVSSLPELGLEYHPAMQSLAPEEVACLKDFKLKHLRVETVLSRPGWKDCLEKAITVANAYVEGIELAVFADVTNRGSIVELLDYIKEGKVNCLRLMVYPESDVVAGSSLLSAFREEMNSHDLQIPLIAATDAFFTEINRNRPPFDIADGVAFSLNPQVHATDNLSLVESLEIEGICAGNVKKMGADSVHVSPLTYHIRRNPNATTPEGYEIPEEAQVEPRQWTYWGRNWTTGSMKYLAEAGTSSVTYFKAAGPCGVFSGGDTANHQPLAELFKTLGQWTGANVIKSKSNRPLSVFAMFLEKDSRRAILIASMDTSPTEVALHWDSYDETHRLEATGWKLIDLKA